MSCWNKNVRNVFKTFYTNLFKMLGLKVTKLDPDKYTHIFYFFFIFFTLLRWDPVTLRKGKDKKQNSNKKKKSKIFFFR